MNEKEADEKNEKKAHFKEVHNARKGAVTTLANMVSMQTLVECG